MKIFSLLGLLVCVSAQGEYQGEISFTSDEVRRHQEGLPVLLSKAAECVKADLNFHLSFYKKWGISPFYGDRSSFAKLDWEGRRDYLRSYDDGDGWFADQKYTESEITYFLRTLRPTSCIGIALKCMGAGFQAAGQGDLWARLKDFTILNDASGGALQQGLQQLGWKLAYWNPNLAKNQEWDEGEQSAFPDNPKNVWGRHSYNWSMVKNKRKYYFNKVDDISTFVNFGKQVPAAIKSVPFFVGQAHMGYHVFPGVSGQIIEGHSTRKLHDSKTIETSAFNPLSDNGGPRGGGVGGRYKSGLLAIPPGYGEP